MHAKANNNLDKAEVDTFSKGASSWWDKNGPYWTLHKVNPLRLKFIKDCVDIKRKRILDIGCGGGILSESLAEENTEVTAIDASEPLIEIAKLHLLETNTRKNYSTSKNIKTLDINYITSTAEDYAQTINNLDSQEKNQKFDIITCMEMLEHVPSPESVIEAASSMLTPGGSMFFSTLNRNIKSYFGAIIAAEYILNLLPKGTHQYSKFIKPSELTSCASKHKLQLKDIIGIQYNPINKKFNLDSDVSINYIAHFVKLKEV